MTTFTFWIDGVPIPQGSKSVDRRNGYTFDANKNLRPWRKHVATAAAAAMKDDAYGGLPTFDGPLGARLDFYMPRPKGHYRTGRFSHLLRTDAPRWPAVKPDVDKLERAIFDALTTAGVWADDARVVHSDTWKRYAHQSEQPGVRIQIWTLHD